MLRKRPGWTLNYLFSRKGVVPYEMNTTFDLLNISAQKRRVFPHHFYSGLKDGIISAEDYNNVKKFWEMMDFE